MKRCVMYTILAAVMFLSSSVNAVPEQKVQICHIEGNGFGHWILVPVSAVRAHLAHHDPDPSYPQQQNPNDPQFLPGVCWDGVVQ